MFGQIFFVFVGCFLIFTGITQGSIFSIALGIICVFFASERLYHLRTGKSNFGLRDK